MSGRASVGVVVAVRNGAAHLAAALDSVVRLNAAAGIDVVVVDGGSTDASAAIAGDFAGVRVVEQRGSGLADARNQGVAAAHGDHLAFLDADDRWPAGSLDVRLRHLAGHPACDAVVGRLLPVALAGTEAAASQVARLEQPLPGYTPGALLVRRDAFERNGGFDTSLRIGCDSDWFVRAMTSALTLDVIDDVVLLKGARGDSLSTDVAAYRHELLVVARRFVAARRVQP